MPRLPPRGLYKLYEAWDALPPVGNVETTRSILFKHVRQFSLLNLIMCLAVILPGAPISVPATLLPIVF